MLTIDSAHMIIAVHPNLIYVTIKSTGLLNTIFIDSIDATSYHFAKSQNCVIFDIFNGASARGDFGVLLDNLEQAKQLNDEIIMQKMPKQ